MAGPFDEPDSKELVFALCHEIGNLVTAVQLEADLLEEAGTPAARASSAIQIEDLCAQVGGLLSQVRPLLGEARDARSDVDPQRVVAAALAQLETNGVARTRLAADVAAGLPLVTADADSLRDLLVSLAFGALDARRKASSVVIGASYRDAGVALAVVDDGDADPTVAGWQEVSPCGRALALQIGRALLARVGGRVDAASTSEQTRVELWLPAR